MATTKPKDAYMRPTTPKRLRDFATGLKTALNASLPSSGPNYSRVAVLAFHWENDNLGVVPLENDLLRIFSGTYHYDVESYTIPLVNSVLSLSTKLSDWATRNSGAQTLRIYVYSGHAAASGTTSSTWYIGLVIPLEP